MELTLSPLGHTWLLDIDGTIVEHNGYKKYGKDVFLEGAKEFLESIPDTDCIIFITSRTEECKELTESFLAENGVRYDHIIYNLPYGERILLNDDKPSGLKMGYAVNLKRDQGPDVRFEVDENL